MIRTWNSLKEEFNEVNGDIVNTNTVILSRDANRNLPWNRVIDVQYIGEGKVSWKGEAIHVDAILTVLTGARFDPYVKKIRAYEWDTLRQIFGVTKNGAIKCSVPFTRCMERALPEDRTIVFRRRRPEDDWVMEIGEWSIPAPNSMLYEIAQQFVY